MRQLLSSVQGKRRDPGSDSVTCAVELNTFNNDVAALQQICLLYTSSEKLIGAPDTAPPEEFFAFTTIGCGSVVPTAPDCFPPETCEMLETLGVEVSVKVADVYSELLAVMVMVSTEAGNV